MRYTDRAKKGGEGEEVNFFVIDFDNTNFPSLLLKVLNTLDYITEVSVKVLTAFDGSATMELGFPADNDEIAPSSKIRLQTTDGLFKFFPYRQSALTESLTAFFAGTPTIGNGKIFIFQ